MRRLARRRWAVITVLFALVWMQLAVAAYACPAVAAPTMIAAAPAHDCAGTPATPAVADSDNPNLCLQHALQGDQHFDQGTGTPPAPAPGLLIGAGLIDASPQLATLVMAQSRGLLSRPPPPKSIVHCCFRI